MVKIRLGISACLLGAKVRYDGQCQVDHCLSDTLGAFVAWHPVCPEVGCGLPVPREAMHLEGSPTSPRLITTKTRRDLTGQLQRWIAKTLPQLAAADLRGFVFKSRSPSSGMRGVRIYAAPGMPAAKGAGLFARAFMARFPLLPVEDEVRLHDPRRRANFLERVFAYDRWRKFETGDGSWRGLADFHARHQLLLMSHSPTAATALGRIVAAAGPGRVAQATRTAYLRQLMTTLKRLPTIPKHTRVLQHLMGNFQPQLEPNEQAELHKVIEAYHAGQVPLTVPITLFRHYVRKFDQPYLRDQLYLAPSPAELRLRHQG